MKLIVGIVIGIIVLLVGGSLLSSTLQKTDPDIISQRGIHWHPQLQIIVKGEKVAIPQNVGIGPQYSGMPTFDAGMRMTAMHTHEDLPLIHLEFPGMVRKEDIMLGRFFEIWHKDMRSFGSNMTMSVNGLPSTEYENFVMHDGDKIELFYN